VLLDYFLEDLADAGADVAHHQHRAG